MNVSRETALFFFKQCAGSHNGHMAKIPNSPVLSSLLEAHDVRRIPAFIEFLEQVAVKLGPHNKCIECETEWYTGSTVCPHCGTKSPF